MKRSVQEVAEEHGQELLKLIEKNQEVPAKAKAQRVVDVLTIQHGSKFPVALNNGTRPAVCGELKRQLGKYYEDVCIGSSSVGPVNVPELPSVPPEHVAVTPTLDDVRARFPSEAAALLQNGAQSFPLLNQEEVATLTHALSTHHTERKPKALDVAQGNGSHGAYATLSRPLPALLQRVEEAAIQWILDHAGPLQVVKRKIKGEDGRAETVVASGEEALRGTSKLGRPKTLLLRYGLGGENYAHHDACGDFQALLLLSQPGVDYTGGTFYLGDANPPFATSLFPFKFAGELLIFRGRKGEAEDSVEYRHGMQEVSAGSGEVTRRFAVGLFQ